MCMVIFAPKVFLEVFFCGSLQEAFCNLCICNMRWLFRRPAAECGLRQQDRK
uniref:Synaptoporin n=1 Tax=Microcebus murinus TaxID=30608 RepID=A0A8C5VD00_MICMU